MKLASSIAITLPGGVNGVATSLTNHRDGRRGIGSGRESATHLKLAHLLDTLDTQLKHVQDPSIEHSREDQIVWSLLRVKTSDEKTCVVLVREELKRRR